MARVLDDVGECVEETLRRVGSRVVLALPLGIGKPNPLANEFYRRAARDPAIDLTIVTALSLARPRAGSGLERRLVEPMAGRLFGNYPDLEYVLARRAGALPPNVRVIEFYLEPGAWLGSADAQRDYLSANYTHVARDVLARGVNVIAHLVAKREVDGETRLSLGSNPDVTLDLLPMVEAERAAGRSIVMIGEVHGAMPYMPGPAELAAERFDLLVEHARYDYDLYAPPNLALRTTDYAIALHASTLVRDGGTLQIGIGELGDALVYALMLRHQQNAAWREAVAAIGGQVHGDEALSAPFRAGLYACSEMLVDQMLDLYRAGILCRRVYDHLPLMRLVASGRIGERFDASILEALPGAGAGPLLDEAGFDELRRHGVFRRETRWRDGKIVDGEGRASRPDLADPAVRAALAQGALGRELKEGIVAHAGFFLGPRGFYAALRELPDADRRRLSMRGVGYVNQLYGPDQELRVLQRQHARFINTTMMVTLSGAAVSDGLDDGRVVSGVGGQYNFVAMAHALPEARSILCVRATRTKNGRVTSNVVARYGHATIPRHLRDLVISEYGIADLRGRTDAEVAEALVAIADARFQDELRAAASRSKKWPAHAAHRNDIARNEPDRLETALAPHRAAGRFSEYPFGTDFTAEEIVLIRALTVLKAATATRVGRLRAVLAALRSGDAAPEERAALIRMSLAEPRGLRERLEQRLLLHALREVRQNQRS
jgi:acyl-CoA hydrolase